MQPVSLPLSRKENIVIQELKDETLIYDLQTNKAFCLNKISSLVWEACDGKKSVSEITRIISRKTGTLVNDDAVWLALDLLKSADLLANNISISFNGRTRREVIKKIGLASMIAIPLVSSVVAPKALQAASSIGCLSAPGTGLNNNGTGCPCTSNDDCCGSCLSNACTGGTNNSSAAICFGIVCTSAPGSGANDNITGCPCTSNADCCGFCLASVCGGANDLDSAPSCP